jgi:type I restriction enzyme, R subunit
MSKPGEHKTVQARLLEYAREVGWTFVPRGEAEVRRGIKESGLSSPLGSSNDAGWKTRAPLSLFFDDLLDAKVRESGHFALWNSIFSENA